MGYVKLLAELDLLVNEQTSSSKSDEDNEGLTMSGGNEEASIYDRLSLNSFEGSRGSLDEVDPDLAEEAKEEQSSQSQSRQSSFKRHQR